MITAVRFTIVITVSYRFLVAYTIQFGEMDLPSARTIAISNNCSSVPEMQVIT